MPTLLDLSPAELDNPLAPHVIRRQQEQQDRLAQQDAALREHQAAQQGALALQAQQRAGQIAQAAQPGAVADAQQQTQRSTMLPMATNDFMSYMMPKTFHKEGADPASPYETGNPYRALFGQAPPEAQQHAIDAYGPVAGPQIWDQTAQEMGAPTPEQQTQQNALAVKMAAKGFEPIKGETQQDTLKRFALEEAKAQEGEQDRKTKRENRLDETEQRQAVHETAAMAVHDPVIGPFATQKDAYDNMVAGVKDPEGGFTDSDMIEAFQRIVNPRAAVRQGTIQMMVHNAGLEQYFEPGFLTQMLSEGDKFSPETRQRLMHLTDTIYTQKKAAANRQLAGLRNTARRMGVDDPDQAVNDMLTYISDANKQPAGSRPSEASATPNDFKTEAEAEAASKSGKLKDGDKITVGGLPATWHD